MMTLSVTQWVLCVLAVALSAVLRGYSGFGFALAATPLLVSLIPPTAAVPVVLMLQIGSSLVGLKHTLAEADRRSVSVMAVAAALATPIGTWLLIVWSADAARLTAAALTLAAAVVLGTGFRFKAQPSLPASVPFGVAAGLFGGLCAMPGPPAILYYLGSPISNATARASMTLLFLIISIVSLIGATVGGVVTLQAVALAAVTMPIMFAGTRIGSYLFKRLHSAHYRPVCLVILVAVGLVAAAKVLL
jgi:uncharacterized membrane protein YfcA